LRAKHGLFRRRQQVGVNQKSQTDEKRNQTDQIHIRFVVHYRTKENHHADADGGGANPRGKKFPTLVLKKERVWSKRGGQIQLGSQEVLCLVGVFLPAFIAADIDTFIHLGWRQKGIGLPEWNFVTKEKVLTYVKFVILANYHPDVLAVVAHCPSVQPTTNLIANYCAIVCCRGAQENVKKLLV
jgi:hypothetical protein